MAAKKPSGAQFKKLRRARAEKARREDAIRRTRGSVAANQATEGSSALPSHLAHFAAVGVPPLDPIGGIAWANVLAQSLAWEIASDGLIDADKRRRQLTELIKVMGTTAPKAFYEARINRLEQLLDSQARGQPSEKQAPQRSQWEPEKLERKNLDGEPYPIEGGVPLAARGPRAMPTEPTMPHDRDNGPDGAANGREKPQ